MINVVYSTEHWIVPRIVICILCILLAAIIITEGRARVAKGEAFFSMPKKFFKDNPDFIKLFGTLVLFVGYIVTLDIIGFTLTSIIFVFLFNILYAGTSPKSIGISLLIAVVASLIVSIAFGVFFKITLPNGMFTITFVNQGFTIY
ncbi:tripartite tricarboxylate transporter TctB family protein [Oribacterium sp. WCC10]|uniref:tripartite tricarboxylate transporter TctB family protein n=1 Tax=Oribacterium sp. WCC10 TaxID=1855343 RepID=UPI0008E331C5|nr:tripartite tricarboxylate transporter TctB family protein [Oribacterium sp. WCC10]SFG77487.1 Tripartite tricarboxylate transporter TctB family protein [Oribacterium sp. WCC10]